MWTEKGSNIRRFKESKHFGGSLFLVTTIPRLSSTFLCPQSGKADWTMLGRNMAVLPPLLWTVLSSQSERHDVSFDWSWLLRLFNASLRLTSTQLQPMRPIMSGRHVKMRRTALKGLHHVLRIRITQITTAMTARMAWHPCACNVMLMFPSPDTSSPNATRFVSWNRKVRAPIFHFCLFSFVFFCIFFKRGAFQIEKK